MWYHAVRYKSAHIFHRMPNNVHISLYITSSCGMSCGCMRRHHAVPCGNVRVQTSINLRSNFTIPCGTSCGSMRYYHTVSSGKVQWQDAVTYGYMHQSIYDQTSHSHAVHHAVACGHIIRWYGLVICKGIMWQHAVYTYKHVFWGYLPDLINKIVQNCEIIMYFLIHQGLACGCMRWHQHQIIRWKDYRYLH